MAIRDYKEYPTIFFWKETEEEDILFFKYAPKLDISIDTAREIVRSRLEYTEGKAMYTVIDGTNIKSITKEARDYMNSGGLEGVLGGAFLSNNVVATLVINLFLRFSNLSIPARFFTDKKDAINWIRKVKAEKQPFLERI